MTVKNLVEALLALPPQCQEMNVCVEASGQGCSWNEVVSSVFVGEIGAGTVSLTETNPDPHMAVVHIA